MKQTQEERQGEEKHDECCLGCAPLEVLGGDKKSVTQEDVKESKGSCKHGSDIVEQSQDRA